MIASIRPTRNTNYPAFTKGYVPGDGFWQLWRAENLTWTARDSDLDGVRRREMLAVPRDLAPPGRDGFGKVRAEADERRAHAMREERAPDARAGAGDIDGDTIRTRPA